LTGRRTFWGGGATVVLILRLRAQTTENTVSEGMIIKRIYSEIVLRGNTGTLQCIGVAGPWAARAVVKFAALSSSLFGTGKLFEA